MTGHGTAPQSRVESVVKESIPPPYRRRVRELIHVNTATGGPFLHHSSTHLDSRHLGKCLRPAIGVRLRSCTPGVNPSRHQLLGFSCRSTRLLRQSEPVDLRADALR